jgi:uncharacterized damage-inducible protein DinB
MGINELFIAELQQESASTRKLLERVPLDKADWKPHEKSMPLGRLATHVAEIPGWTTVTMEQDELDFATMDYKPVIAKDNHELVKMLDENLAKALKTLKDSPDERFSENWTMRTGDKIYFTLPKAAVLRSFAFNHQYHHRAQLTVYLRLLDVPLPGIYGPTADETM